MTAESAVPHTLTRRLSPEAYPCLTLTYSDLDEAEMLDKTFATWQLDVSRMEAAGVRRPMIPMRASQKLHRPNVSPTGCDPIARMPNSMLRMADDEAFLAAGDGSAALDRKVRTCNGPRLLCNAPVEKTRPSTRFVQPSGNFHEHFSTRHHHTIRGHQVED